MIINDYKREKLEITTAKEGLPLQEKETAKPVPEHLVREVWLNYYNDYLRERGVITDQEWRKMRLAIGGLTMS